MDSLRAQHMGVHVHALALPGGGWHQEPRVCACLCSSVLVLGWSRREWGWGSELR